jgi:hypothetical protein
VEGSSMKYLLIIFILLNFIACSPTQDQIDQAIIELSTRDSYCRNIAVSMNATADYRKEPDVWVCFIYFKDNLDAPFAIFYDDDLARINRYLLIKSNSENKK